jgi:hypothetical protein
MPASMVSKSGLTTRFDARGERAPGGARADDSEGSRRGDGAAFPGFAPLQSNTTYCPNQFFDVVLPHFSRGVVRLVGYILYRAFAWSHLLV